MNVPLPAPCHVNVAGVGKQSVWGLRIIARSQLSLWHDSVNPSIPKSGLYFRRWCSKFAFIFPDLNFRSAHHPTVK
jgi:hypothetical protein